MGATAPATEQNPVGRPALHARPALLAVALAVALWLALPAGASAEKIVFFGDRVEDVTAPPCCPDFFGDIFIINDDGSGLTNLTNDEAFDRLPSLSPDGSKVLYSQSEGPSGNFDVYRVNSTGGGMTPLYASAGVNENSPRVSPEGTDIVFLKEGELRLGDINGSADTAIFGLAGTVVDPEWGSNDRVIYSDFLNIFSFDPDTVAVDGVTQETTGGNGDINPGYMPNGKDIVFERGGDIYVKFEGGVPQFLVDGAEPTAISDDEVAFVDFSDSKPRIAKINLDGSGFAYVTPLTPGNLGDQMPHAYPEATTPVDPDNKPPKADFSVKCTALECKFTDKSTDPDGTIVKREWDFDEDGDYGDSAKTNPKHTYSKAPDSGSVNVSLRVTDDDGAKDTKNRAAKPVDPATAPDTKIVKPKGKKVKTKKGSKKVKIKLKGTDDKTPPNKLKFQCKIRKVTKGWDKCKSGDKFKLKAKKGKGKKHNIQARAIDRDGNKDPTPANKKIKVVKKKGKKKGK